jgi:hypothetical protein
MALNHIDAAVESFKQALELEPNDGLCITLSSSLVNLLFTTETTGFCLRYPPGGIKRELAAAKKKVGLLLP